jgi:hypothetical protein
MQKRMSCPYQDAQGHIYNDYSAGGDYYPRNCRTNFLVSQNCVGLVHTSAHITDTAYDLFSGESFSAGITMLPALLPSVSFQPMPPGICAIGCWPTISDLGGPDQCGPTNTNYDYYRSTYTNTAYLCSTNGNNKAPGCYNYFCGSGKSAYSCGNSGDATGTGYCKVSRGGKCEINSNNCASGQSCYQKDKSGNWLNSADHNIGTCCYSSGDIPVAGSGAGNECTNLLPCSCSYGVDAIQIGLYIGNCRSGSSTCARFDTGFPSSPWWQLIGYSVQ